MAFFRKNEQPEAEARLQVWVHGKVQGVGFRWWVNSQAKELGLAGIARNLPDGRVHVVAEGTHEATDTLERRLQPEYKDDYRPGNVQAAISQWSQPRGARGFRME